MSLVEEVLLKLGCGRRLPDDAFFSKGDIVCQYFLRLGGFDIDDEQLCHAVIKSFPCHVPGCVLIFDSMFDFGLHYNSVHRYFCSECKKRLPSPHLLDLHLSETHDSFFLAQAEKKPMYTCFVEECKIKSANPLERRNHCISDHKFPSDFRFDNARKQKPNGTKKHLQSGINEAMETDGYPSSNARIKKKSKKPKEKKTLNEAGMVVDRNVASSSSISEEKVNVEQINDKSRKDKKVPPQFKPFSFGRGGRGGGRNWFQVQSSTPKPDTLDSSLVDDLRASLPESMT